MTAQVAVSHPADGVGLLLIDAPPRNFLTAALGERLEAALYEVRAAGSRVVVLSSAVPGYFVAHMALDEVIAMAEMRPLSGDVGAIARFARELRNAQPETLFGLMAAGGGTSRIPRLIGEARAPSMVDLSARVERLRGGS